MKKKTWGEKLRENSDLPKVVPIEGKMTKRWGTVTVVIPSPLEVDSIMKLVRNEHVITIDEIRDHLARNHGASIACSLSTRIFA